MRHCKILPAIPVLALKIFELCQDPKAHPTKLADLIGHDPAFAAKLLNLANSGLYARIPHRVTSLSQAVTLLGTNAVAILAFSFSLYRHLRRAGGGGFDHSQFWRRSILASVAGRSLAKWANLADCEVVFLGALLQDIGMLVLSVTFTDAYHNLIVEANRCHDRLQELEHKRFSADHAEVGTWLAEQWQLPDGFQAAIRGSHNPGCIEWSPELRPMVHCVALSGWVADIWCDPETEKSAREAATAASTLLGIEGEALDIILTDVAEGVPPVSALFEIDLGTPEEIRGRLQTAKDVLLTTTPQDTTQSIQGS